MSKKPLVLVAPPALPASHAQAALTTKAPPSSKNPFTKDPSTGNPFTRDPSLENPFAVTRSSSRAPAAFSAEAPTLRKPSSLAIPVAQPLKATKAGSTYVYGDSTPFPYDIDFIRTIDDAVTCCVTLLQAETSIIEAQDQATAAEQVRQEERVQLMEMGTSVRDAIMQERAAARSQRVVQTGTRLLSAARATVEQQIAVLEKETEDAVANARKLIEGARAEVHLALENFLAIHDIPKTDVELSVVTSDEGAGAIVTTTSSYGLQASFEVAIPDVHAWRKTRRVRDICAGTTLAIPKKVGLIKKRVEPRPFKLDDLFIRSFVVGPERGRITFNKKPQKPDCVEIELDFRGELPRAAFRTIDKNGLKSDVYELPPDERAIVLRLWRFVTASSDDLKKARRAMKRALFEGRPIMEVSPETLCRRIVATLAPTVREIAKRAGARGELCLRRSVGAWERHESFITSEELLSRTYELPVHARRILDPICAPQKARSVIPPALPPPSKVPMLSSSALSSSPSLPALPPPSLVPPRSALRPPPLPKGLTSILPPPLPPSARMSTQERVQEDVLVREQREEPMFPPSAVHTIDVPASDVSVLEISVVEVLDDLAEVG